MRKVIVNEWMSLDGVIQAPGGDREDTDGGFAHGGWHMAYMDDMARKWVLDYLTDAGGFLLGRRTYEIFAAYWPTASEEEQVVAQPLNTRPKFVATTTLSEPLDWADPHRNRRNADIHASENPTRLGWSPSCSLTST